MNLSRTLARTATARTLRSAGAPWSLSRVLAVLAWPFGGRRG